MDTNNREAFAVREFCARYGICRDTFYSEVRRGRLRAVKLGKKTLVLKAEAETGLRVSQISSLARPPEP